MQRAPLFDCHAHIFRRDLPQNKSVRNKLDYDFTAEDYLAVLDKHGVHFGVIAAASNFGDYNDYVIECLRRHKRLRATVTLRPDVEAHTLKQMAGDGVVGVRLMLRGVAAEQISDFETFEYQRFFRRLRDADWHVHLHMEATRSAPLIDLLSATGVKLVLDHFGNPDPQLGLRTEGMQAALRAVQKGRTWIKLSGGFRQDKAMLRAMAPDLIKSAGPERLVWGSDCPFASFEKTVSYQDTLNDFHDWVPDPAIRHIIGCETPAKLYLS